MIRKLSRNENRAVTLEHVFGEFGAHSRHLELARGLGAKGWDVLWIAPEHAHFEVSALERVRHCAAYTITNMPISIPILSKAFRTFGSLIKFRRDVAGSTLILFSELDILAFWLARPIIQPNKVVFMQRSDAMEKAKLLLESENKSLLRFRFRLWSLRFIYQKLTGQIDRIIVQTPHHERRLRNIGVKTPISIVANNINPSWITNSTDDHDESFPTARGTRFLLVANLFYRIKGFDLLFDSLKLLQTDSEFTITIVGDGIDEEKIRQEVSARNLNQIVKLFGRHPNASTIIPLFDGLLVPSPYDDCPNVVLEAINAQIPILATQIDAHRFLLGQDFPFLGVSPDTFSLGIKKFLEGDDSYRQSLIPKRRMELFKFDWPEAVINEISA